jgi:hypothetical protein
MGVSPGKVVSFGGEITGTKTTTRKIYMGSSHEDRLLSSKNSLEPCKNVR